MTTFKQFSNRRERTRPGKKNQGNAADGPTGASSTIDLLATIKAKKTPGRHILPASKAGSRASFAAQPTPPADAAPTPGTLEFTFEQAPEPVPTINAPQYEEQNGLFSADPNFLMPAGQVGFPCDSRVPSFASSVSTLDSTFSLGTLDGTQGMDPAYGMWFDSTATTAASSFVELDQTLQAPAEYIAPPTTQFDFTAPVGVPAPPGNSEPSSIAFPNLSFIVTDPNAQAMMPVAPLPVAPPVTVPDFNTSADFLAGFAAGFAMQNAAVQPIAAMQAPTDPNLWQAQVQTSLGLPMQAPMQPQMPVMMPPSTSMPPPTTYPDPNAIYSNTAMVTAAPMYQQPTMVEDVQQDGRAAKRARVGDGAVAGPSRPSASSRQAANPRSRTSPILARASRRASLVGMAANRSTSSNAPLPHKPIAPRPSASDASKHMPPPPPPGYVNPMMVSSNSLARAIRPLPPNAQRRLAPSMPGLPQQQPPTMIPQ